MQKAEFTGKEIQINPDTSNVMQLDLEAKLQSVTNRYKKRRRWVLFSFIPFVLIPFCLALYYYTFVAADRYASEMKFTVSSPSGNSTTTDLLGVMTGITAAGSTMTDSYIVVDFLESRELIDLIEERMDLRSVYNHPNADFLARLDPEATKEDFADYLQYMIDVYFDTTSQIITVEVQAFTPEDAERVAAEVLALSENLVNELSEKARFDTMRSAQEELLRVENSLREHRKSISRFREKEQDVDPTKTVEAQQTLLGELQGSLADAKTRLNSMLRFMNSDAPSVRVLNSKISALEQQVKDQRSKLGLGADDQIGGNETLTTRVGAYEELAVDLEFLQQAYVLALSSLERARIEADRQQRYLSAFVKPRQPQESKYPERALNIFLVFVVSLMIWGVSIITYYVVREHAT